MKPSRYSEFANYILLAYNSDLDPSYTTFLKFKEVSTFLKTIVSKNSDTFLYKGTIYKKKITSSEARSLLDSFFQNRCNASKLRIVANQLKIRI